MPYGQKFSWGRPEKPVPRGFGVPDRVNGFHDHAQKQVIETGYRKSGKT